RSAAPGEVEQALLADDAARLRAMLPKGKDGAEYVRLLQQPGALTAALNWYRAMTREDMAAIGPVTAPTLYVWSDGDHALGRAAAEACGQYVEGPYRFEVVEGVDHWVPEKAAETLNRLLLFHLENSPTL
ncbi:MAG TPA: alpha/beta hydrolase, partial [Acidimicrobiales bacterium]|nr:alpha/beta hydrolase [Acidimicrobiales bacterium]